MNRIPLISALLFSAVVVQAEIRMFSWGESRDETTGESLIVFALAPEEVMRWAQADAAGDVAAAKALERELPKEPWIYALGLRGKAKVYRKGTIELFEPR